MKHFFFCFFALTLLSCASLPKMPQDVRVEPLRFNPELPDGITLSNGLVVYYGYDSSLPLMSGELYFRGGSLFESQPGLASAAGSQMREGALEDIAPDSLDSKLDSLGASIETSFGQEYGSAGFSCLAEDVDEVFALFSRIVREPAYDAKRLALWKHMATESIRRRGDQPSTMAELSFQKLVYGEDSAYNRIPTESDIQSIEREDLQKFHARFLRPNGSRLALSGSLPPKKAMELVRKYFGNWKAVSEPLPELPQLKPSAQPGVYILKRPLNQATIIMGHQGPPRHTKDRYAMTVYNQVFGWSGFSSVLFQEIRTKMGLAYSVYGGLMPGERAGTFRVGMATRSDEAPRAVTRVWELIDESRERPYSEQQSQEAVTGITKSFVFKFKTPASRAERAALLAMLGYPPLYDKNYLSQIYSVSVDEVGEVPRRWVHPEKMITVIVGNVDAEDLLKTIGEETPVFELEFDTEPRIGERVNG